MRRGSDGSAPASDPSRLSSRSGHHARGGFFTRYWVPRTFHVVPVLWSFHAIHRSIEEIDWLAVSHCIGRCDRHAWPDLRSDLLLGFTSPGADGLRLSCRRAGPRSFTPTCGGSSASSERFVATSRRFPPLAPQRRTGGDRQEFRRAQRALWDIRLARTTCQPAGRRRTVSPADTHSPGALDHPTRLPLSETHAAGSDQAANRQTKDFLTAYTVCHTLCAVGCV